MALNITNLAAAATGTDGTSVPFTFTPSAGGLLILVSVDSERATNDPPTPTISDTQGMVWFSIVDFVWMAAGANRGRINLFAGLSVNTSSTTATVDYGGTTEVGFSGSVEQCSGSVAPALGVAAAFVQTDTTVADSTATSVAGLALNAAGNTENRAFAAMTHLANEGTTPQTNWTELRDITHTLPSVGFETQWRLDQFDTTPGGSWTTSAKYGAFAVEIRAALEMLNNYKFVNSGSGISVAEKIR